MWDFHFASPADAAPLDIAGTQRHRDFNAKQAIEVTEAIQVVSYMGDEKTRKRELRGLMDCCNEFGLHEGLIITLDGSEEIELNGIMVRMVPLYRWLLSLS